MKLIKCSNCGSNISERALKCPKCGYKLNSTKQLVCIACGNILISGHKGTCPICGDPEPIKHVNQSGADKNTSDLNEKKVKKCKEINKSKITKQDNPNLTLLKNGKLFLLKILKIFKFLFIIFSIKYIFINMFYFPFRVTDVSPKTIDWIIHKRIEENTKRYLIQKKFIIDNETGLMWRFADSWHDMKSSWLRYILTEFDGSYHTLPEFYVNSYVEKVNEAKAEGYDDWRLPTCNEFKIAPLWSETKNWSHSFWCYDGNYLIACNRTTGKASCSHHLYHGTRGSVRVVRDVK